MSQADCSKLYIKSVDDSRTEPKATAFTNDCFVFPVVKEIICNI